MLSVFATRGCPYDLLPNVSMKLATELDRGRRGTPNRCEDFFGFDRLDETGSQLGPNPPFFAGS